MCMWALLYPSSTILLAFSSTFNKIFKTKFYFVRFLDTFKVFSYSAMYKMELMNALPNILDNFICETNMHWENCVGMCTNGAKYQRNRAKLFENKICQQFSVFLNSVKNKPFVVNVQKTHLTATTH